MSDVTYGPIVPEGQYPPFAVVTPDDHSAWIIIAAALGLTSSLVFGAIRVFVRQTISPQYGLDDISLAASTILAVIQSSIVLGACSEGLGKSLRLFSPETQTEVQRMYYTSNLFYILALGLSKSSIIFFLRRLTAARKHKRVFDTANVLVALWTIGSFFAIALQCNLSHPWISTDGTCSGTVRQRSSNKDRVADSLRSSFCDGKSSVPSISFWRSPWWAWPHISFGICRPRNQVRQS